MPRGQPTKYRKEYCQKLVDHCSRGLSFDSFAGEVGVNVDTLYEWCKVHKDFSDAKKRGRSLGLSTMERMGLSGAMGRIRGFNVTAWIFFMKNVYGWRDINHNINADVTPQLIIKYKKKEDGTS